MIICLYKKICILLVSHNAPCFVMQCFEIVLFVEIRCIAIGCKSMVNLQVILFYHFIVNYFVSNLLFTIYFL